MLNALKVLNRCHPKAGKAGPPNQLSKKGGLMKKKRAVSNLFILASPGGTTMVCTGE